MINVAVDVGNGAVKACLGGLGGENELYIPNIIADAGKRRKVLQMEKTLLQGLHVQVTSGALSKGMGIYKVGELATKDELADELTSASRKFENDQIVILLLTTLAVHAAECIEPKRGVIDVTYNLSTGLPLQELKNRETFAEKIKKHQHEVTFLQTPKHEGVIVHIHFAEVLVNPEGASVLFDFIMDTDGSMRNEDLSEKTVLINDIGGLSTNSVIVLPGMDVDYMNSKESLQGVLSYLDAIREEVEDEHGYTFYNRQELIEIILHPVSGSGNHIKRDEKKRKLIQDIVDRHLKRLAKVEYKHLAQLWRTVPSIELAYQSGGGAVLVKPYLEKINQDGKQYPLRFMNQKDSVWTNARAYWKLLVYHLGNCAAEG